MSTQSQYRLLWDLGLCPFKIGAQPDPENPGFPNQLPFRLGVDTKINGLVQMPDTVISRQLEAAYRQGSQLGTPLNERGLGRRCCDDFLDYIVSTTQKMRGCSSLQGLRVLEIGCGTGYLLRRLHEEGAEVLGFEPGKRSPTYADDLGLKVIREPFTANLVDGKFDLIVHYGVLEHVENPANFLRAQSKCLKEGGIIIFACPDCSESIAHGDISILAHEHWNYFTESTLLNFVQRSGFTDLSIQLAHVGGALYAAIIPKAKKQRSTAALDAAAYRRRAQQSIGALDSYMAEIQMRRGSLGIFVPARFINYMVRLKSLPQEIRFFDDEPLLTGKYYPPYSIPIENRESLLSNPVTDLLIMSRTFGPRLASSLRTKSELANCSVRTVADIF